MDDVDVPPADRTEDLLARWREAETDAGQSDPGTDEHRAAAARAADARRAFHTKVDGIGDRDARE